MPLEVLSINTLIITRVTRPLIADSEQREAYLTKQTYSWAAPTNNSKCQRALSNKPHILSLSMGTMLLTATDTLTSIDVT